MTTSTPDIQPAVQHTAQVAIVGAGPVGLMMANYLGQMGISVLVVEKLATLIDYPRAIGIDDESLRAMQAVGLVNDVLPHTTPWHAMRFLTPKGRCFADIQPMTDEFGWSRRNAFIQPQVDAVMYHGLQRFPQVRCLFSREVEAFSQTGDSVTLNLKGPDGERETVRADWLVACDGGASFIRRTLNIPFEGKTAPNQWIVIDIANDPLATPHVYLCCDPVRPYVSAALPHGVRRFEFMVMPGETEAQLSEPHNMRRLLSKVLPDPDRVELIRQRVYTHNARLAERFRINRVLLAGDAAHIMPVWQGQGYNSGMRDAFNLAWKLALVVNGKAGEALLDSYQQERRDHAKAMIDLSVTAGHVLAPPKRWQGAVRDGLSWLLNYLPPVKRYFLEMRFKPMPQYREGALLTDGAGKTSPVPAELAEACAHAILNSGIDLAVSYNMQVDHGFAQPLEFLLGGLDRVPVLPVFINGVAAPLPGFQRTRLLGEAMGRFLNTLNKRVLILGSGGLSHQPPVPELAKADAHLRDRLLGGGKQLPPDERERRQQRVISAARRFTEDPHSLHPLNPVWDNRFMSLLEQGRLSELDAIGNDELSAMAGKSTHEIKTWVAAFAALSAFGRWRSEGRYYRPIPEWIAGFGSLSATTEI
ncbi:TPA: 3-carboxyethylcatechol 2,3-dioxygenase [Klebsiella pneumoniae]|nr:hypothetical protein CWN62_23700 [Klebsiella pneumoniae]HBX8192092.1 3-carboxyethylcatechol 2,3-dioxygenase [Klebsiella pneumoniae]